MTKIPASRVAQIPKFKLNSGRFHRRDASRLIGVALGILALWVADARPLNPGDQVAVNPGDRGQAISFVEPHSGKAVTLRQTDNQVSEARVIQAGGSATIAVWNERAGGVWTAFYAVSMDGGTTFSRARETSHQVRLRYANFDPLVAEPIVPAHLRAAADGVQSGVFVVQFVVPPLEAFLAELRDLGATPHRFQADHAYIVAIPAAAVEQVRALPYVRWVGPVHPAYKLEEELIQDLAIMQPIEAGGGNHAAPAFSGPEVIRRYSIMLYERGPAAQAIVAQRIAELGGTINTLIPEGFRLEATLDLAQLRAVAAMNEVHFIDRWGPPETDMDVARQIGGAVPILSDAGFTGQGVRGEVMDLGIRLTHQAFQNPPVLVHGISPNVDSHGTNTYGIVFGNGAANSAGTGLLPDREQGIFADFNTLSGHGGSMSRYIHTQELINPALTFRAVFQSNSWGSALTTQYTSISAEMDDILFLNNVIICQSQSNAGTTNSRPQAWAKNIVAVGGVGHFNTLTRTDDSWTQASFGPASDGRVKPDLTHFYDDVLCPTSSNDTAYTTDFGGTSAATPITCGHFGLMFQMWHEEVFAGHGGGSSVFDSRPKAATARALMINSAFRYNWLNGGPNGDLTRARQGWGMADVGRLYLDRDVTFIVNETDILTPFASHAYDIEVPAGQPELRVTMVYSDPMGNVGSAVHRINDLSLRVTSPGGTPYWGNNGLATSNWSTSGGVSNTKDTVENVFLQNPEPGLWLVEVFADELVQDGRLETPLTLDADFALVVAGGVPPLEQCAADITGDGQVGVDDLLLVINNWGGGPGNVADVDADGDVDVSDLLSVINQWGDC